LTRRDLYCIIGHALLLEADMLMHECVHTHMFVV
jgi:hypothetical protein